MERVAFIVEETKEQISCLLNPEYLLMQRLAGVQTRQSLGAAVSGALGSDTQLLFNGGGHTDLTLSLLFDVDLAGSSIKESAARCDVRDLTAPIWRLAENVQHRNKAAAPPICRFIWGKCWNIPAVVTAIAEKHDRFSSTGVPQRSWMRLRLRKVSADPHTQAAFSVLEPEISPYMTSFGALENAEPVGREISGERIDLLADHYYNNCSIWRLIARYNHVADPFNLDGLVLEFPSLSVLKNETQ